MRLIIDVPIEELTPKAFFDYFKVMSTELSETLMNGIPYEERPQGDLISRSKVIEELNYLKHIGYDNSGVMKLQNMEIQRCISVIEDAPTVKPCDNCDLYFKAMTKEEMQKNDKD